MNVAFRSAKAAYFRGAKGDYAGNLFLDETLALGHE